jgi:hypothetical protein
VVAACWGRASRELTRDDGADDVGAGGWGGADVCRALAGATSVVEARVKFPRNKGDRHVCQRST